MRSGAREIIDHGVIGVKVAGEVKKSLLELLILFPWRSCFRYMIRMHLINMTYA